MAENDESVIEENGEEENLEEEETLESLKERLSKADAALRKANREAATLRKKYEPKKDEPKKTIVAEEGPDWKSVAVLNAAKVALKDAGLVGNTARVAKLLNLKGLEVDEDGDVEGLEDEIEALKEDMPSLFKIEVVEEEPQPRRSAPKLKTSGAKETAPPKSVAEARAAWLLGAKATNRRR